MNPQELVQGSPEWYAFRAGKVSASRIADLTARTKTGWSTSRKHYMDKLVAERITGRPMPQRSVPSLDRRLEMEPEARTAYEFYSDYTVRQVGCVEHPRIPNALASPDGLIDDDGGLEIKNCDTPAHIEMLTTGVIDKGYIQQCDFGMACTGRKWWDFASYDPSMPEDLKLYVQRIYRDDARIADIESSVIEFLAEVDQRVEKVLGIALGQSPLTIDLEKSLAAAGRTNVVQ